MVVSVLSGENVPEDTDGRLLFSSLASGLWGPICVPSCPHTQFNISMSSAAFSTQTTTSNLYFQGGTKPFTMAWGQKCNG